jgi:hypothetical protein
LLSVIDENLKNGIETFLNIRNHDLQKSGSDEKELRKMFTEETVNQILKDRALEEGIEDDNDVITIYLLACNMKIFNFYITHCKNLFCFAGMGGVVSFDWQAILIKSKIVNMKINETNLRKLEAIEDIVLPHVNKNT